MKTLIVLLTFISLVVFLNSCSYTIEKYKVDPETGKEKRVAYNKYSYNVTPEMIEADYNSDIMKGVAEHLKPHSKKDKDKYIYMSETGTLTAMEIGGAYYQSKGYGWKRIDSRYGTVVGSVTSSGTNYISRAPKQIPGFSYEKGAYFWNKEDPQHLHRLSLSDAQVLYSNPKGIYATGLKKILRDKYGN